MQHLLIISPITAEAAIGTPVSITALDTSFTQNFNSLAGSGTSGSSTPDGWDFTESGTNANTAYTVGTGSGTSGDTYSFGTSASSERAFGGLRSGSLVPIIGATFTNNTGSTINSLTISYTGEQWRAGVANRGAADRLDFQISTNATSLSTGTYTDVNALDFSSPNTAAATGALDGNLAGNRTAISSTITGLSVANGATFFIRWIDFDIASSDDGLAIDDFSIAATGTTTPSPSPTITTTPTPTPTATPTPTPTATPTPTPTPVPAATHVVISQVYGGGGNSGAAYTNDYVELYNPTGAAVSLTGWTLQYASATGSGWDGSKQPLGGSIGAGEYYLVGLGTSNSSIGSPLPTANVSGELNLSGSAGKIGLVGNG
ncbi:MAG: lamin tail domain-containing protein, partial [Acidobacteriota bacterium]|nr:lamin tail domain-containing protein [Acidobacteriota bacterium]